MRRNAIAASGDIGQRHGGDGMDDEKMMREALRLAQEADAAGEVPVGCVVALGDHIVGTGRNRREEGKSALAHAEIEAIAEACRTLGGWRLWQCTLYVTLEPCPMCAGAIMNARIPRIVYGAKDTVNGCCGSAVDLFMLPCSQKPEIVSGVLGHPPWPRPEGPPYWRALGCLCRRAARAAHAPHPRHKARQDAGKIPAPAVR